MDIKQLREHLKLTQTEFASRLGLSSKGHVSDLEREGKCSVRVALKIEELAEGKIDAAALNQDVALMRAGQGAVR